MRELAHGPRWGRVLITGHAWPPLQPWSSGGGSYWATPRAQDVTGVGRVPGVVHDEERALPWRVAVVCLALNHSVNHFQCCRICGGSVLPKRALLPRGARGANFGWIWGPSRW